MLLMLCIKLFFVRIIDVSLGTTRTILMVKGKNVVASLVGFIEVAIWFAIVKEALNTDIESIWIIISYAGGFATGTYVGGLLSDIFISGSFNLQIITSKNSNVVSVLRNNGFAVSVVDIKGQDEKAEKHMLFIEINKKHFNSIQKLIKSVDPKAFIVVNETKFVENGYFKPEK
ncbi:MAG: DUF5698 domain-containing protein [Bacilli bacterium]|nr:DUF5698 domain-containing protein [Bacilli bacterium]